MNDWSFIAAVAIMIGIPATIECLGWWAKYKKDKEEEKHDTSDAGGLS